MSAASALAQYLEVLVDRGATVVGRLAQPASDEDVLAVAAAAGRVPADLDDVWRLHNGTRPWVKVLDGLLCPPFRLLNTAETVETLMDRRDPENLWSDYFEWSTEFDGLGICLPILDANSLSLMIDVDQPSGELLLFDSHKTDGIVLATGLDLEAWFELQTMFLVEGWVEVVDGRVQFPAQWPSTMMPSVEPRLLGLETWNPEGPGIP